MSNNSSNQGTVISASPLTGEVHWFNDARGFGFIKDDNGTSYYVHYNSILMDGFKTLDKGQKVKFIPCRGPKGLYAESVSVLPKV